MKKQFDGDSPWFVGGVILSVFLLVGGLFYFNIKNDKRELAEYLKLHPRIVFGDYVRLTIMGCRKISDDFKKEDTKGLSDWERDLTFCGEQYPDFYLRHSLIRTKLTMYSVDLEWYGKDNRSAKITKVNVPYCEVCTDKKCLSVSQKCEDIP